mmetsp:Transcript_9662/g.24751  ORF Transcript_9662/g.24751 Transcript_9662/m.24751 type:complete len:336 (+) Transcript_9662:762-1769(+)
MRRANRYQRVLRKARQRLDVLLRHVEQGLLLRRLDQLLQALPRPLDLHVQLLLLLLHHLDLLLHVGLTRRVGPAHASGRGGHAFPLDVVLLLLLDQPDPLEHVRDVVDAPLLHVELLRRLVQIQNAVLSILHEHDKLLGEEAEGAVVSAAAASRGLGRGRPARVRAAPTPALPRRRDLLAALLAALAAHLARRLLQVAADPVGTPDAVRADGRRLLLHQAAAVAVGAVRAVRRAVRAALLEPRGRIAVGALGAARRRLAHRSGLPVRRRRTGRPVPSPRSGGRHLLDVPRSPALAAYYPCSDIKWVFLNPTNPPSPLARSAGKNQETHKLQRAAV